MTNFGNKAKKTHNFGHRLAVRDKNADSRMPHSHEKRMATHPLFIIKIVFLTLEHALKFR